jgi:hypothetical protein
VLGLVGIDITSTAHTKLHSILIKKFQCNVYNYTKIRVDTDKVLLQTFSSLYWKVDINLWQSVGLGWDDITSTAHSLSYILYLSRNCNVTVITTPNLGWYRFGLVAELQFMALKSRQKFVAECWSWLGWYHKYGPLTQLHSILIKKLQCNGHNYTKFRLIQIWSCCRPLVHCIEKLT